MGWIKERMLDDEVGPGNRRVFLAAGNIPAYSLVKRSGTGVIVCGANDLDAIGVTTSSVDLISTDSANFVLAGPATMVADVAVNAGEQIKCGYNGKAHPALTLALSGATIGSSVGSGFANQPANDGLEVLSANAADTMDLTIYGTTDGGVTVVAETVTLTGTTPVSTVKVDWGVILGWEIPEGQRTAAGIITVREASGNQTISTMAAGTRRKGIVLVSAASQRAFNHVVGFTADSTTTKTVGLIGTDSAGATIMKAMAATSAVEVQSPTTFRTVTKLLVGDLEVARTGTFKTDLSLDGEGFIYGVAKETVSAGETFTAEFFGEKFGLRNLYTSTVASIPVTATSSETEYNRKVTIPANVLVAGRKLRITFQGIITAANATDGHTTKLVIGSTTVVTSTVSDATANDIVYGEFTFVPRAAAGATAACVGAGQQASGVVGTVTSKPVLLASTNFATNGSLEVKVTGTPGSSSSGNSSRLDVFVVDLID